MVQTIKDVPQILGQNNDRHFCDLYVKKKEGKTSTAQTCRSYTNAIYSTRLASHPESMECASNK